MNFLISLVGIAMGVAMIKYRQVVGDMIGEAGWMRTVGGVYNFILIVSVLIIFFSLAKMTGTTGIFLSPLLFFVPGGEAPAAF